MSNEGPRVSSERLAHRPLLLRPARPWGAVGTSDTRPPTGHTTGRPKEKAPAPPDRRRSRRRSVPGLAAETETLPAETTATEPAVETAAETAAAEAVKPTATEAVETAAAEAVETAAAETTATEAATETAAPAEPTPTDLEPTAETADTAADLEPAAADPTATETAADAAETATEGAAAAADGEPGEVLAVDLAPERWELLDQPAKTAVLTRDPTTTEPAAPEPTAAEPTNPTTTETTNTATEPADSTAEATDATEPAATDVEPTATEPATTEAVEPTAAETAATDVEPAATTDVEPTAADVEPAALEVTTALEVAAVVPAQEVVAALVELHHTGGSRTAERARDLIAQRRRDPEPVARLRLHDAEQREEGHDGQGARQPDQQPGKRVQHDVTHLCEWGLHGVKSRGRRFWLRNGRKSIGARSALAGPNVERGLISIWREVMGIEVSKPKRLWASKDCRATRSEVDICQSLASRCDWRLSISFNAGYDSEIPNENGL
ncbi:MAG: hypothetical protein J0I06_16565 [Planctomycetes bacterium]|nr:hypothetical protein [Planctomycetota bacterium]